MLKKTVQDEVVHTDILILGGGIAGCFAAISAKKSGLDVFMVDKANLGRSGLSHQMSGVLTYFDPEEDDHDLWYRECVEASLWLADQKRLEGMIHETTERIMDLEGWGAEFQKDKGHFIRKPGLGHKYARNVIMINGGFQLMSVLRGAVLKCGVRLAERVMAFELMTSDGQWPTGGSVTGVVGFNTRNGKFYIFKSKATVIATGSTLSILPRMPVFNLSGDGKAMAFRAGAEMRNVELAYYGLRPRDFNTAPGANILFSEGAILLNAKGERFMQKYDTLRLERAPRTVIGCAMIEETLKEQGPIYLDATRLDESAHGRIEKAIPILVHSFKIGGLDLKKDPIPYEVTLMDLGAGGIRVDTGGATLIPGLYAAGAASDHGEDGVTNIISHGMEAAIGGQRAGESASMYAAGIPDRSLDELQAATLKEKLFAPLNRERGLGRQEVRARCVRILRRGLLGPTRTHKGLNEAINELEEIRREVIPILFASDYHELAGAIGIENGLLFLELLGHCALLRTESRGPHFREDHPLRDDKHWLKWVVAKRKAEGIEVRAEKIPFHQYRLRLNEGEE